VFVQDILDDAVSKVFASESGFSTGTPGTVSERQRFARGSENLHMMLDFVYTSGPERLSHALGTALDAFAQVTHTYVSQGTAHTPSSDDEDTDTLINEAREATARAGRTLYDETGSDSGDTRGETQNRGTQHWRKQA
jgi:hypothetical protein